MKKKLYVRTYGCQMNAYDSVRIKQMLSQDYEETDTTLDADLIIINTCSVRKKPEEKLFAVLGTLKPLKQKNKNLIIGVGGCVAQQYGSEIIKRVPHVDFVFGTHNLSLIPEFIKDSQCANNVKVDYKEKWEDLPVTNPYNGALSISVAISRGCKP